MDEELRGIARQVTAAPYDDDAVQKLIRAFERAGRTREALFSALSHGDFLKIQEARYPEILAQVKERYRENREDALQLGIISPDGLLIKSTAMRRSPEQRNKSYQFPSLKEVRLRLDFGTLEQAEQLKKFVGGIQNMDFEIEPPLSVADLRDRLNPHIRRVLMLSEERLDPLRIHEDVLKALQEEGSMVFFPSTFTPDNHNGLLSLEDDFRLWFKDARPELDERIHKKTGEEITDPQVLNRNAHEQLLWIQKNGYDGITPGSQLWAAARAAMRNRLPLQNYPTGNGVSDHICLMLTGIRN